MEATYLGFLDETSSSQAVKSPAKTSTVAKENIKWDENVFFQRQDSEKNSESLFLTPTESPIPVSKEPIILPERIQKIKFNFNDSYSSEGANSSLGILNVDLTDLSDMSFQESTKVRKQKSKGKSKRNPRMTFDKNSNFEKATIEMSKEILKSLNEQRLKEAGDSHGSASSSDIEFDGTNIPELNMDYDVLSLVKSDRARSSTSITQSVDNESASSHTFTKIESDASTNNESCSQQGKDEMSSYDLANGQSSRNGRSSIFENFSPSYGQLSFASKKETTSRNSNERSHEKIRVCPFLGVSSFEVEPILQKHYDASSSSEIEKTRCNENTPVDFCPEQISARSSSFKSSVKYNSSNSATFNVSDRIFEPKMSLLKGDLENEVLSGSCFQTSGIQHESQAERDRNDKDSGFTTNTDNSSPENAIRNSSRLSDLAYQSNILSESIPSFLLEGENWSSRLGISESEFFSSEAAKEMLKKDKEIFEKEHIFESVTLNNVSGGSNWSPPNINEITASSRFSYLNPDTQDSDRQISIGTLISARSEYLGSLSEDEERERPYFGTVVTTPPKESLSDSRETGFKMSDDACSQVKKVIRMSALSEILDEISLSDPINVASKIVEKCALPIQADSKKLESNHKSLIENIELDLPTETSKENFGNVSSDIDTANNTVVMPSSNNSLSKHSENDMLEECKSTEKPIESMNNSFNFSVHSTSDTESIKTAKTNPRSNCCSASSRCITPQEYSRPPSSCSSACNPLLSVGNAFNLQYGCMRYLNSGTEDNQNGVCSFIQNGSTVPCQHVCSQHAMQPNLFNVPNQFQSAIQNAISGALLVPGNPLLQNAIQAPSELYFPEKISIGDSQEMTLTIRHSAGVACYYHISCASAYLNDSPLPPELSGLSYNKTVPCSVGSTTDVKLIISPKYEGKIEVNLQIDAFLNFAGQTLNAAPGATMKTKIHYEVMQPSISIQYKGKRVLNLGAVIAGSSFIEHISVINNCEVPVPLTISLSNDSLENHIYFGLKEMDRKKHPVTGGPRFLSPKVLLYHIPASKDKNLPSSLDIPLVFESINSSINSSVTAAIQTPTLNQVLAFMTISASVGSAKLLLKDNTQNPLTLKTSIGAACSHSLTVMNDGTLPVVYDIYIDGDSNGLSVLPNSLNLQPKQCATISVTFTPLTCGTVKGNLLAAAQPHGQVFTVTEIVGHAKENYMAYHKSNVQTQHPRPTRDSMDCVIDSSSFIECNKKYLAWGGTDVGSITFKTFTLRNPGLESLYVKLFIKEKSQGFQIIDESNQKTTSHKFILASKEEKHVSVVFSPKSVESYSGLLCIKPIQISGSDSRVFSIRLSGYGGTSKIKVLGLPYGEGTGYCLNIEPSEGNIYKNITLCNTGLRPAFVKLLITYESLVQNPVAKQTVINPSEFVLLENEKKNVFVSVNCMNRNPISDNEIITVIYGDELLRQIYRRKLNSNSLVNDSACNINFNVPFDGEDRVPYDSSYGLSSKDEALFYSSLTKLMIYIVFDGQNRSFSRMSFGALSEVGESFANLTLDTTMASNSTALNSKHRRQTIDSHSPPVKDSAVHNINRLSLPIPFEDHLLYQSTSTDPSPSSIADDLQNLKLDSWTVHPEELIIDADNKDKRILLKNYSSSDMRFKIGCTIDVITISPLSGILPANGEIGLRLTLINPNHNKLIEDYHGIIRIMCDGAEKTVVVKVCKDHRIRKSPVRLLNDSLRSGFLGNSDFLDSTLVESLPHSITVENILNFPKLIDLQKTRQSVLSETVLIVGNPNKNTVTWNIHPTSMLFAQPFDDSIDCNSSAFELIPSSGILKSMESSNIMIKFFPQCVAQFSQFFEIALYFEENSKQICNLKIQGEAVAELPVTSKVRSSDVKDKKQNGTVKKRVKSEIFTVSDICKFPNTVSGQKSTAAITIKNISHQDTELAVIRPKLPFVLNHSTCIVKSKKYIKIPAFFKPLRLGSYESDVKFICENGNELIVKLCGSCSA